MAYLTRDIVHFYGSGNVTGYVSGSTPVNVGSNARWAGVEGSTAYGVGDIVTALKRIGVLAQ